jgi:hypothetical protein
MAKNSLNCNDILAAQLSGALLKSLLLWPENDLGHAIAIPQIDKDNAPMISPAVYPAR